MRPETRLERLQCTSKVLPGDRNRDEASGLPRPDQETSAGMEESPAKND